MSSADRSRLRILTAKALHSRSLPYITAPLAVVLTTFIAYTFEAAFGFTRDLIAVPMFGLLAIGLSLVGDRLRRRTQRLREFEKAVDGLEEMIVVVDRNYRYLIANEPFVNFRGVRKDEVIGHYVREVLGPAVFEGSVKAKLDECFRGRVVEYEMRFLFPRRGKRDLMITYFPVQGELGVDRVACVLRDTTDSKESQSALRLFRALMDESNDSVFVVDPETYRILDVNEKGCRDLGYTREELLTMSLYDIHAKSLERECQARVEQLKSGRPILANFVNRRKDGSTFPVEASLKYVQLDRNYIISVSRDISERVRAEQALRESEDRYRDLVEHSEDLVCTHDLQGTLLSVNPAPARTLGYEVAELLGMPMRDLIAPEFRGEFDSYLDRIRTNGADHGLLCVQTRTGQRRIWDYRNTLRTEGVPRPMVRGLAHDVTERWMAEKALAQREQDYREFVAQSSEGIFRLDMDPILPLDLPEDEVVRRLLCDARLAECNDSAVKMYGFRSRTESLGKPMAELLSNHDSQHLELVRDYVRSGYNLRERQWQQNEGQGNAKSFSITLTGIVKNQNLTRIWGIQRDVTGPVTLEKARARAEAALRKSEEHFRILVEQASDGIYVTDSDGYYIDANTAGAEMLGYTREELLKLSIRDVVAPSEIHRISAEIARFAGGAAIRSEWTLRRKDGSSFPGEICGKRLPDGRLQGILRDMTDRRKVEEEMRHSVERFRVALKHSPITVFNQDRDLRYTWVYNPQLFCVPDMLGKTDEELLGTKRAAALGGIKRKALTTGHPVREEVVVVKNGKRFAFDMSIEPLFDNTGTVVGLTGACADIARLLELADHLQDSADRLEKQKSYLEKEIRSELGFSDIIGQSPCLAAVLKKTRVVAPTDSTVLLLGETGTGKELIARSLHSLSERRDKTFVKLNCAAVPSGLLESELFGHEKGAYTSAVSQKIGRVELADKGTLFLDEIGELPPELQPKLLRVLQDREFERLGGVHTLKVDVRIISATNRDLRQDVLEKRFREDLYYRLNVFPIELPPLRERREDIPGLVRHFVEKYARRMGKHIDTIPDEIMSVLQNWRWPGNVRELENMVERLVILTKRCILAAPPAELGVLGDAPSDDLGEMEREHIIRVLRETNGVLAGTDGAAVRLGVKRTTLQSMLKRFGIEVSDFRGLKPE